MTPDLIAQIILVTVQVYLIIGLTFAIPFVLFLAQQIDPAIQGSTWGFKLLALPGLSLLWPLMLSRLIRRTQKPIECNAHRLCALAENVHPTVNSEKS